MKNQENMEAAPSQNGTTFEKTNGKDIEKANNELKKAIDLLVNSQNEITAFNMGRIEQYYGELYMKHKIQTQKDFQKAQKEYKYYRENRDTILARFKQEGVNMDDFKARNKQLNEQLQQAMQEGNKDTVIDLSFKLKSIEEDIQRAKDNIDGYIKKKYIDERKETKKKFDDMRDKWKYVRTNRKEVIEEFKEVETNLEVLAENSFNALNQIQNAMNILYPTESEPEAADPEAEPEAEPKVKRRNKK